MWHPVVYKGGDIQRDQEDPVMDSVGMVMRENLKLAWRGHRVVDTVSWTGGVRHPFRHRQTVPVLSIDPGECLTCEGYLRPGSHPWG